MGFRKYLILSFMVLAFSGPAFANPGDAGDKGNGVVSGDKGNGQPANSGGIGEKNLMLALSRMKYYLWDFEKILNRDEDLEKEIVQGILKGANGKAGLEKYDWDNMVIRYCPLCSLVVFKDDGEPPFDKDSGCKSARTGNKLGDPIYINRAHLYIEGRPISIAAAAAIVLDELAHQAGIKVEKPADHIPIDLAASHLQQFLSNDLEITRVLGYGDRILREGIRVLSVTLHRVPGDVKLLVEFRDIHAGEVQPLDLIPQIKRVIDCTDHGVFPNGTLEYIEFADGFHWEKKGNKLHLTFWPHCLHNPIIESGPEQEVSFEFTITDKPSQIPNLNIKMDTTICSEPVINWMEFDPQPHPLCH